MSADDRAPTAIVSSQPVLYHDSIETLADDEAETADALDHALQRISETTYAGCGHAMRSVHAKSHGLLIGELVVGGDEVPSRVREGLFAEAGRYEVILRFSTIPGDLLPDSVSTPRGLAIKVLGVDGERLPGSEGDRTQDFVLVNGPAFLTPDPKAFLGSLQQLAKTTDRMEGVKVAVSSVLQAAEKVVEALGGKSPTLISLGGHPETSVLGETYWSQVPIRWGRYIAKIAVAPVSTELARLTGSKVDLDQRPDGLRDNVVDFFAQHGAVWELRAQLCTNLDHMPVEDASVVWPEAESPYLTVARIVVPAQIAWSEGRAAALDDSLAFSPWHGLAAHRPLGGVMRARKATYAHSAALRAALNSVDIREPLSVADLDR